MRRDGLLTNYGFLVQLESCPILIVGVSNRTRNHFRVAGSNLVSESIFVKLLVEFDETEEMTDGGKHALADMVSSMLSQTFS